MNKASLSQLRDIAVPLEPGLWPMAPGLWLLLALVFSLTLLLGWSLVERWKRNAYRRAGLLLLPGAGTVYELSVLLKRVAFAAYSREEVASLYGSEWIAFLSRTCPGVELSGLATAEATSPAGDALKKAAARWIRFHRPEAPREEGKE